MEEIKNITEVKKMDVAGKINYSVTTEINGKKIKQYFNENFDKIVKTADLTRAEENSVILKNKELKKFINNFKNNIKKNENDLEQKIKTEKSSHFTNKEEREKLLKEKGIEEGKIFCVGTYLNSKERGREESQAYYEVYRAKDNELRLRPFTKLESFKSTGNNHFIANADALKGVNALALIDEDFAQRAINAHYQKNHPDEKEFFNENIQIDCIDSSKWIKKALIQEREQARKEEKSLKNKNNDIDLTEIKTPDSVKKYFESNNKNITDKDYTEKMYQMFKTISSIPNEDLQINNLEKKLFKPLILSMNKTENETEKKLAFNRFLFDNKNNTDLMTNMNNLFEKQLDKNFRGFKKKHSAYIEKEREDNIEAIKNNNFPIMKKKENVDYIYNAKDNSIYKGNNQIALQRNNEEQKVPVQSYVSADDMVKNNVEAITKGYKMKCEIVELGELNGKKHWAILVPCKPTLRERIAERKAAKLEAKKEKDRINEEYRRNIADAKYVKKYQEIPEYKTSIQPIPEKQPPLSKPAEIPLTKPEKETSIENKIKYEFDSYFKAMFTKEAFVPQTDWTKKENKEALLNFAKENPEKLKEIADKSYENVAKQVLENNRKNNNVNQVVQALTQTNENVNENHKEKQKTHHM